jgi:hypothetical protein
MADEPTPVEGDGEPQGEPEDTTDWKAEARKHENRAKRSKAETEKRDEQIAELQGQVEQLKAGNSPEMQQELDKARREGRKEAEQEFLVERRSDRLQVAVAGHARDLADVDDVVLNLQRGDTDDLFDQEGNVDPDQLQSTLSGLLERKPHLKATPNGPPQGGADQGRGEPAADSPTDPASAHNTDILASLGLTRQ